MDHRLPADDNDSFLCDTADIAGFYRPYRQRWFPHRHVAETLDQAILRIARGYQMLNKLYNPKNGSNTKYARDL
jgi:hypothetical protein